MFMQKCKYYRDTIKEKNLLSNLAYFGVQYPQNVRYIVSRYL